jgi:diguanylate cyclase (GGDEF)-like protein
MEEQLRYQGTHDALTGIYNRAFFEAELGRLEHSREFPVSIIVADIDKLKVTNDTRGHAAGDEILRQAAGMLASIFRAGDVLARIGGDEFAVFLPRTNLATVEQIVIRVKEKLAEHNAEHPDLTVQLSLGTATAEKNNLIEAFRVADRHMYADKAEHKANVNIEYGANNSMVKNEDHDADTDKGYALNE